MSTPTGLGRNAATTRPRPVATESCALSGLRTGRWFIDASRSTLQVSVKVGLLATVNGRFGDVRGFVDIADDPSASTVSVTVPTTSLSSGNSAMDGLLHNAGIVDSRRNPVLCFASRALRAGAADGQWFLDGLLATDHAVLDLTFEMVEPTLTGGRLTVRARGELSTRDAVRLLSHPGVEKILGRTMRLDLTVVAVAA